MMRSIILIIALISLSSCNFKAKGNHGGIKLTHDEAVETVKKEEEKATEVVPAMEAEEVTIQANEAEQVDSGAVKLENKIEEPALEAPKEK